MKQTKKRKRDFPLENRNYLNGKKGSSKGKYGAKPPQNKAPPV